MVTAFSFFICLFQSVIHVSSLNNGLARKPPLGWRSWSCYWFEIDQPLITACIDALLDKSRKVNGVAKSLAEIGYNNVGIDDGWQLCDSSGKYFHNATAPNGWAMVNKDLFPDLSSMIKYAHNNKLGVNWYFNNCHCSEHELYPANEENDVRWLRLYDLDGVKLDGCGSSMNTSNWQRLIGNETGTKPILTEDGGNNKPPNNTNEVSCPMNMYNFIEGSGIKQKRYGYVPDVSFPGLINTLQGILPFVQGYPTGFVSYPGCWAFPGDLQVGNIRLQYKATQKDMDQTIFSAWGIVSSPMVLGFDLTNQVIVDRVWSIVTNNETIAVSQNWAGHPGRQIACANYTYIYDDKLNTPAVTLQGYEIWAKPQPSNTFAVLLMNNDGNNHHNITVQFKDVPWNGSAYLRDIVNHKDLGSFSNSYTAQDVPAFASVFLLFS
eukprot:14494_1